jgi:hypothetical protein
MEFDGHLKVMALELACQRLAQRMKLLSCAGVEADYVRLAEVDRLVARSIAVIEQEVSKAAPAEKPSKKKLSAGMLLRLLVGGDEVAGAAKLPERSLDSPPTERHVLTLRGSGDGWPTPDLLGFLSSQRKTGVLEIATANEVFVVEFEAGDIVHAQASRTLPEQRLGDILVAKGAIARDTLEKARNAKHGRLGELLLEGHHVTHEQLLSALQTQIQLLFNRLFASRCTRFSFWGGAPIRADGAMRLNAMALILEGARVYDEQSFASSPADPLDDADAA